MKQLRVYFLGSFQLTLNDIQSSVALKTDKSRALFAYLLAEKGHPHRRAKLIDLLWTNFSDKAAHNNLRQALHHIHALSTGLDPAPLNLLSAPGDIQLVAQPGIWVDAFEFTAELEQCEAHHCPKTGLCDPCLDRLRQAISLYQGEFMDGFSLPDAPQFDWWLLNKRETFCRRAIKALSWISNSLMLNSDYTGAVNFAQREVELFPWSEPAHQLYMRTLALVGERCKALHQFEVCKNILSSEGGIEPSRATQHLYEKIRDDTWNNTELLIQS